MEEKQYEQLLRPLLSAPPVSSNSGILLRLSLVVLIGIVSIWANHEVSKGYAITIVNESSNTFRGKRFHLFYVSNDEATRIVIKASQIIHNFLYPDHYHKKPIKRIILRLSGQNLTQNVIVESNTDHEFILNICPSVMEGTNFGDNMVVAVRQGVARIWLWDGQGQTPQNIINGIVQYLVNYLGSFSFTSRAEPATAAVCWKQWDPTMAAESFNDWERSRPGFLRRLNQAMKDGWDDEKLGTALGLSVKNLCSR